MIKYSFFLLTLSLGFLTFLSAKDTFLEVYTNNTKYVMKVSLANFGYFKYGHRLTGRLQIGARYTEWGDLVNKDRIPLGNTNGVQTKIDVNPNQLDLSGCNRDFQQFNEKYVQEYGNPIYFLDRGNCSFIKKSGNASKYGKMLIVADNSNVTDVDNLIMSDDLSGDKVTFPVVLISKKDGQLLKKFLFQEIEDTSNSESNRVHVSILFNKPYEGQKAEIQYWMIPSHKPSYQFFKNHTNFLLNLLVNDKITLEPHFAFFHCGSECKQKNGITPDDESYRLKNYCIFEGDYCHPDPDGLGPLTGVDSIYQSITEMCIHNDFPQFFLTYLYGFSECYVDENKPLKTCANEAEEFVKLKHINAEDIHFSQKVKECFNRNSIQEPDLIAKEYALLIGQGLKYYPALFVNGQMFRGDLAEKDAAQQFICSGIENSRDIIQCKPYSEILDDEEIWVDKFQSVHSSFWFWLSCGVLLIIFIVGLFIYRRNTKIEIQKELAIQVDTAIQQYYALSESR